MLDDYELLYLAREGTEEAIKELKKKYTGLIYYKAIKYSYKQGNLEDYLNEGFLCLYQAIDSYIDTSETKFIKYLDSCLDAKMINYRKLLNRKKHNILNSSISLEDNYLKLNNSLEDNKYNPDNIISDRDNYEYLRKRIIKKLNSDEELVFILKEQNFSVDEISRIIDKRNSDIYNIIKSIRTKVTKITAN